MCSRPTRGCLCTPATAAPRSCSWHVCTYRAACRRKGIHTCIVLQTWELAQPHMYNGENPHECTLSNSRRIKPPSATQPQGQTYTVITHTYSHARQLHACVYTPVDAIPTGSTHTLAGSTVQTLHIRTPAALGLCRYPCAATHGWPASRRRLPFMPFSPVPICGYIGNCTRRNRYLCPRPTMLLRTGIPKSRLLVLAYQAQCI